MRVVSYEILIHAPADTVDHHLTDPIAVLSWIADSAESQPIVGGGIRWTLPDRSTMLGSYVELRPRHGWDYFLQRLADRLARWRPSGA